MRGKKTTYVFTAGSDGDLLLSVEDLPHVGPAAAALDERQVGVVAELCAVWRGPGFESQTRVLFPVVHSCTDDVSVASWKNMNKNET